MNEIEKIVRQLKTYRKKCLEAFPLIIIKLLMIYIKKYHSDLTIKDFTMKNRKESDSEPLHRPFHPKWKNQVRPNHSRSRERGKTQEMCNKTEMAIVTGSLWCQWRNVITNQWARSHIQIGHWDKVPDLTQCFRLCFNEYVLFARIIAGEITFLLSLVAKYCSKL